VELLVAEDAARIESTVVKQLTSSKSLVARVFDWVNGKLRSVSLPSLSYVASTNSIHWYFNCTSIYALEQLRNACDSGELKKLLEEGVTTLSKRKDRVHLDVKWSNDDYQSCKQYLNSDVHTRVFGPRPVRTNASSYH
jgi:hypothetical protein